MIRSIAVLSLLGLSLATVSATAGNRHHKRPTACQTSASNLYHACQFEIRDDYSTTLANCRHEPTEAARSDCRRLAREEFWEGRKTCRGQRAARRDTCDILGERRYADPLVDLAITFVHPDDVPGTYDPNPYVSVVDGRTLLLRGGEDFEESVVIHVSEEIREVQGVPCRVVWDLVFVAEENDEGEIEYDPVEVTEDWFAQTDLGDVVYCGEAVQDYEDGIVSSLEGSFESGKNFDRGGFLTKVIPVPGDIHRQEMSLGNAEDVVEYLDLNAVPTAEEGGENPAFACAPDGCLRTFDFSPLDPEATEFKYYLGGTGFVLAVGLEDGELTGEREELVCAGDSLDVLNTPACGVENPDALRTELCELVPDALCE